MVICLPGIASKAKRADTSAIRSEPFVITINWTTVMIKKITPPTIKFPPVTKCPNASTTSPASPFARIHLVDAILNTRRNIVPIRMIEGNVDNSSGFEIYKDIISKVIPSVMLKLIAKFIIQVGSSISRIKTKSSTNIASEISLIGFGFPPCA